MFQIDINIELAKETKILKKLKEYLPAQIILSKYTKLDKTKEIDVFRDRDIFFLNSPPDFITDLNDKEKMDLLESITNK